MNCQNPDKICKNCQFFNKLELSGNKVKNHKLGNCNSSKIFGYNFVFEYEDNGFETFVKDPLIKDSDMILLAHEYHDFDKVLCKTRMVVGENFGCINFKKKD